EKPDASTAASYLTSGDWLWNAGIFIGSAAGILQLLGSYQPGLSDALHAYTDDGGDWADIPAMAIDYAIAQPAAADGKLMTIPAEFGWKDIGDFATLADIRTGTSEDGDSTLLTDASGLVINHSGRAISVLGIDDAVVVDTGDNVLITTRSYAQRVKDLPAQWRARGRDDLTCGYSRLGHSRTGRTCSPTSGSTTMSWLAAIPSASSSASVSVLRLMRPRATGP